MGTFRGIGISPYLRRKSGPPSPVAWGQLFTDNYQRASLGANYTVNACTASIVANQLVTSDPGGNFAAWVNYSGYGYTQLNSWIQVVDWICPSVAVTSVFFVGIHEQTINSGFDSGGGLVVFAGGLVCEPRIYISGTLVAQGTTIVGVVGNAMRNTLTFVGNVYTLVCQNITLGTSTTLVYTGNTATPGSIHSMGYFAINPYLGATTITNWSATTNELKYADYGFEGDSITQAHSPSVLANLYPFLVQTATGKTILKVAGSGNTTQDVINALPEVIAFKPNRLFIMIGTNDIYFGVPTLTWQANIDTIISTLNGAGISFTFLYPPPLGPGDTTPVATYINGLGVSRIDTQTPLSSGADTPNPTMFNVDLIHPNNLGNSTLSATIVAAL